MRKALVIDDAKAVRMILRKILAGVGYEVHEAENGQVALDKLQALGTVELCCIDWNMPVMNGYEFIRAVRKRPEYRDVTLMMVTTESEHSQMVKALAAGANEFVMKPFTSEVILDKLSLLGLPSSV